MKDPIIIGEGGESVVYRTKGNPFVTKAFRDRAKFVRSNRSPSERADSTVLAGEIGIAPYAVKKGEHIVDQGYLDLEGASLEDALLNGDSGAVKRILRRQKSYHDRRIYFGDTAASNLFDPAKTGGKITVDATHIGYAGKRGLKYALGDLGQTQWEADYRRKGDLFFDAVGSVYGSRIQDELGAIRAEQQRSGRVKRIFLQPLEADQLRRAARRR